MKVEVTKNEDRCIELCRAEARRAEKEKKGDEAYIASRLKNCISMCSIELAE